MIDLGNTENKNEDCAQNEAGNKVENEELKELVDAPKQEENLIEFDTVEVK